MKNSFLGRWFLHQLNLYKGGRKSLPQCGKKSLTWEKKVENRRGSGLGIWGAVCSWLDGQLSALLLWKLDLCFWPLVTLHAAGWWLSPEPIVIRVSAIVSSWISLLPVSIPSNLFLHFALKLSFWKQKFVSPWYLLWLVQGLLIVSLKSFRPVSLTCRVSLLPLLSWPYLSLSFLQIQLGLAETHLLKTPLSFISSLTRPFYALIYPFIECTSILVYT